MQPVGLDPSKLKETRATELVIRFAFGGTITAAAGWVATEYGPSVGGLLLAFPAIFPATVTLVQKHTQENSDGDGEQKKSKGRTAAATDAGGAALGSLGLGAFAMTVLLAAPALPPWAVLFLALVAWCVVSTAAWMGKEALSKSADGSSTS